MFTVSIIVAIIIGYLTKGKLSNLIFVSIRGLKFIFASFLVELIAKILLKAGIMEVGTMSFILHLFTYILLFVMIFKNWEKHTMKLIGIGFLMNGLVIFTNGGMMPVGKWALNQLGIPLNTMLQGMYHVINEGTHFKILADIMPLHLKKIGFILSIGDWFIIIGMMLFIIYGMKCPEGDS